ncbi:MAG: hypothetical protein LBD59_12360 [Prevotellaceae bacterium]|jgi:hypothetical protein|nr:hypothetical protein [Prevotellaceae bacterium]
MDICVKLFNKRILFLITFILAIFLNATPVYANVIWPSLYIISGMMSWWIIAAGLIIEFIFIKIFTKDSYIKSVIMDITINTISSLVGIVVIPLTGILIELIYILFDIGGWNILHWILGYLFTVFCNAAIESLALTLIFKKIYKKVFWWMFCANIFSVIMCILKIEEIIK